ILKRLVRPGSRAPSYCTGAGKVLLSHLSENQLNKFFQEVTLLPYTPTTITDPTRLRQELQEIRQRGFALDYGEREEEVRCVAAPIFNHDKKAIAAISVAGPAQRMPPKLMTGKLATAVVQVALQISSSLGYRT
ncbi:MAG: IclR family transcriptional regulator, partial [Moorella sp. (in: firmicutes)]